MIALFRALLFLYPAAWRAEYGEAMCSDFAARLRNESGSPARLTLWLHVIPDLIMNAAAIQWDFFRQDVRYSLRSLFRSPGFTVTAIAIAAAGTGATTAAFTMVDHVLVRPLPFPEYDRIVKLRENDLSGLNRFFDVSPANYRDWKRMSTSYESVGAYRGLSVAMTVGHAEPQQIEGAAFTWEVFPALGVKPFIGRAFTQDDDSGRVAAHVILSYGLCKEQFGGTPDVLGRTVYLDSAPYTVIGVMPETFFFPTREARLWTAMRFGPQDFEDRTNTFIFPVARLKPDISIQQARAEMQTVAIRLARAYPKELKQVGITVTGLRDDLSTRSRLMLNVLLGAAACLLIVACTNLANLLMARAMMRRHELAVRTALGAGRERLVRQMLTESLLLAIPGGALGLLVAFSAVPLLVKLVPAALPITEAPTLDGRILLVALLTTFVTGIAFGVVPATRCTVNAPQGLHEGGRSGTAVRRESFRSTLVVVEIAASVILLVAFGLLGRALWRLQAVDPGFRADHVLTLRTSLPMPAYDKVAKRQTFYQHVLDGTRRLPGVTGAAYTSFLPMVMGGGIWPVEIEGKPEDVADRRTASLRFVTPDFFRAMGIPLLNGRDVRETDSWNRTFVALVSQSFVKRYWPNENPIGRHINIGNHDRVIIGVVGDIRNRGPEIDSEPQVYASWLQPDGVSTWYAPKDLVVRTTGDPVLLASAIRRIIRETDSSQPISDVQTLTQVVEDQTASRRVQLGVLGCFGATALLLAAVGVHGLLAFAVTTRMREIGVRVALGARRNQILAMTLGESARLAALGVIIGLAVAFGIGHLLESVLAGTKASDPIPFVVAVAVSFLMTIAGSFRPVMRALRVDPCVAMRAE